MSHKKTIPPAPPISKNWGDTSEKLYEHRFRTAEYEAIRDANKNSREAIVAAQNANVISRETLNEMRASNKTATLNKNWVALAAVAAVISLTFSLPDIFSFFSNQFSDK